ncbi:hypothetical protein ACH5RR_003039 [Cinchona calisaya]|uniref:Reverse transcriptase domain-containing protein n=1 Tax=Cinchona calisaya TaxID=153742 RepID=A0ABD3ATP2_9GENT
MTDQKAPGADDYPSEFFKCNWGIVGEDFIAAIRFMFQNKYVYFPLDSTVITLVPKIASASHMKNFRPISCCNIISKCFSKILTDRLKRVLDDIIGRPLQYAFLKGRQITDNVMLMHELVRDYGRKEGILRAALKINIMKAYDTIS